ncbi:XPB/Ssl2-like helicase family protein [Paenibacillus cellulosilyticus]|uniref:XPB/Ssl2-like helicase family protein n=1 Tax=Paenibacillus cellulosilyticus TaxID=375489 RepID=A0A2V2YWK1_9BACL|nr:helicase-associated domain-containing protein [Paenibacillus cellulosilyticus]PWW06198.1 XPB/Ssl2-like helicase family protein [Paenibacillus cellulosilyticus]QKS43040.1 helicase-associated domain-containing protein [Paenibacillus cellulosilyticus]
MMLNELRRRLSVDELARLDQASMWGTEVRWSEAILRPDVLREMLAKMSPHTERLIRYWVRSIGPIPIQEEQLQARCVQEAGLAGAELRSALRDLRSSGVLFAVRKSWGEQLLFLPSDCYLAWRRALAASSPVDDFIDRTEGGMSQFGSSEGSETKLAFDENASSVPLGRRLVRAYAALHTIGLDTTSKGLFSKKIAADIARIIALRDVDAFGRLRPVYQEQYPFAFSLALDIAARLGLIVHREGAEQAWSWSTDTLEGWLGGNPFVREAELIRLFTIRYGFRNPAEAALTSGLLLLGTNESHQMNEPLHPFLSQWIEALCACGWASMTSGYTGGWKFQWLIDPWSDVTGNAITESILILPDGEVIVPPGVTFSVRWLVEQAAEWVNDDTVTFYRITDKSVMAAAERGVTAKRLVADLQHASGDVPLPEELEHSILHWVSRAGRTMIEQVMLLRCDTKEIADAAASREALSSLLQERLGDRTFIIRQSDEVQVRRELERAGWPPMRQEPTVEPEETARTGTVNKRKPASRRTSSGVTVPAAFIYDEHALHMYELLAVNEQLMKLEQAGAAPAEWPAAWTGQLRQYHFSTRKQMIEQALAWGAPLELRTGGRLVELVPERLDDSHDSWSVAGYLRSEEAYEPVRLLPDMWDEMRLIIPL